MYLCLLLVLAGAGIEPSLVPLQADTFLLEKRDAGAAGGQEEIPHVQDQEQQWRGGTRRYPMCRVMSQIRNSGCEEISHVRDKEQGPCFAEAAMKRYPTSKVRETPVRQ